MIAIQHLNKVFSDRGREVVALSDVNLHIRKGDIFGIIGMSGAGKSTLLRCLSMLETPTSGSILLDGVDTAKLSGRRLIEARRKMGVVFQGYNLLMQRTVYQNVAFPLTLSRTPESEIRRKVESLLELVGLTEKAQAYPSQLSGGQKQRVALARALATDPEVLLCDEPTSALDSLTTASVLELLQDISGKLSVTIVIITHEISVVRRICNKVAVIDSSHFVEVGDTGTVFDTPQSPITLQLLGVGNL